MVSRGRRLAAAAGAAVLAGSLSACNKQSTDCHAQTEAEGECIVDTTGDGGSATVTIPFFVDPAKGGKDFPDYYNMKGVEGDVARFVLTEQENTCRQGDVLEIGNAQVECQVVEERRLKIRIWVGEDRAG